MNRNAQESGNFLVLGHRGFLGQLLIKKLKSLDAQVRVLEARLSIENVEGQMKNNVDEGTTIFNCIASGVTPNTGGNLENDYANHKLIESLLGAFTKVEAKSFIHFASNYEDLNELQTDFGRNSYVSSKTQGSDICRKYSVHDNRVHLVYLPTILDSSQPRGRFFADFLDAYISSQQFKINFPKRQIQIMSSESFSSSIDQLLGESITSNVHSFTPDASLTVSSFAQELNLILRHLGQSPVDLQFPKDFSHVQDVLQDTQLSKELHGQLALYVEQRIGR